MSSTPVVPLLVNGQWHTSALRLPTFSPFDGTPVAQVCESTPELLLQALAAARAAAARVAAVPARERAALLRRAAEAVRQQAEPIARTMAAETGKPVRDGRVEVLRSAETLELSAEEAVRIEGAQVPMEASAIGAGKLGVVLRFPVGVVAAITPFNAPINLTAHKLGPAWAAGNAVVLKPSPRAALSVHRLIEALLEGGVPREWLQVVQGDTAAAAMVKADEVDFVSFTGSSRVGAIVKASSGLKRVALELGGNGFTIVADDAPADAALTCARNATRLAGQSCISVQNVLVHRSRQREFADAVAAHARQLRLGNPMHDDTEVGPVISAASAQRIQRMVDDATAAGARLLCGGRHDGALFHPTVLADVPPGCSVVDDEVFGPVVSVLPYDSLDEAIARVNAGPYGLQAGIYTQSMPLAMKAAMSLRMGAVIVNGSSTWRSDQAPYGGVKASGMGREGPRFAIRDMTDERFIVFNT